LKNFNDSLTRQNTTASPENVPGDDDTVSDPDDYSGSLQRGDNDLSAVGHDGESSDKIKFAGSSEDEHKQESQRQDDAPPEQQDLLAPNNSNVTDSGSPANNQSSTGDDMKNEPQNEQTEGKSGQMSDETSSSGAEPVSSGAEEQNAEEENESAPMTNTTTSGVLLDDKEAQEGAKAHDTAGKREENSTKVGNPQMEGPGSKNVNNTDLDASNKTIPVDISPPASDDVLHYDEKVSAGILLITAVLLIALTVCARKQGYCRCFSKYDADEHRSLARSYQENDGRRPSYKNDAYDPL